MPLMLALGNHEFKASLDYSKILLENQNQKNKKAQDLKGQQNEKQTCSKRHLLEEA